MSTSPPLPDKIGRYQILACVGRGGMGVLYRGFDSVLDREVAVKVMLSDFSLDDEHMRTRFYREAKAAAKLQHRNIVTVFEFAEEANQPHIVMEFLRGVALGARMTAKPPLSLDDKLDIVAQLCAGLGYAHSQGVVHRDVKPANVFLLDDGTVKLLDFGIAKLTSSTLTQQGDVLGSVQYMSPEQVAGSESVDGRADIWSTGVLLFELLSGRTPFDGDALTSVIVKILKEEPPPIDTLVPGLPKPLVAAVRRALEKDPAKRTPKAEELGRELQSILKSLQASGRLAPLEETRYDGTQLHKALLDDRLKDTTDGVGFRTLDAALDGARDAAPATTTASKRVMVAAGIAAAVVAVVGASLWLAGSRSAPDKPGTYATPSSTAAATSTPAGAAAAKPPAPSLPYESSASKPAPAATEPPPKPKPRAERLPAVAATSPAPTRSPAPTVPSAVPALPASMVEVSMSAAYPFEVFDGSRSLSSPGTQHDLPPQPDGRTLRVVAPDVFLDRLVRIDGGPEHKFDYSPPGLGRLVIRAARGDCRIMVGKRDLGYGPLQPLPVAAGDYQVSLACPDGQNPVMQATVMQGAPAQVFFKK